MEEIIVFEKRIMVISFVYYSILKRIILLNFQKDSIHLKIK